VPLTRRNSCARARRRKIVSNAKPGHVGAPVGRTRAPTWPDSAETSGLVCDRSSRAELSLGADRANHARPRGPPDRGAPVSLCAPAEFGACTARVEIEQLHHLVPAIPRAACAHSRCLDLKQPALQLTILIIAPALVVICRQSSNLLLEISLTNSRRARVCASQPDGDDDDEATAQKYYTTRWALIISLPARLVVGPATQFGAGDLCCWPATFFQKISAALSLAASCRRLVRGKNWPSLWNVSCCCWPAFASPGGRQIITRRD
jgi:hypothetical protein